MKKNNMIKSWNDIHTYFSGLVESGLPCHSLLKLIEEIRMSTYSEGLFAWTSMNNLCISQAPIVIYPHDLPCLRISTLDNDRLEFRYLDTVIAEKQWHRIVEGADGFARLKSFLTQLHWF